MKTQDTQVALTPSPPSPASARACTRGPRVAQRSAHAAGGLEPSAGAARRRTRPTPAWGSCVITLARLSPGCTYLPGFFEQTQNSTVPCALSTCATALLRLPPLPLASTVRAAAAATEESGSSRWPPRRLSACGNSRSKSLSAVRQAGALGTAEWQAVETCAGGRES